MFSSAIPASDEVSVLAWSTCSTGDGLCPIFVCRVPWGGDVSADQH
uniref:Uncharacterized protein n=1 Tax=Anguilla anguilla TaxID=7936 RepID=A0A0E9RHR5_ANGAN